MATFTELCKQKRRAKQRNDELEFSRVPYSDPKQKRASARKPVARSGKWGVWKVINVDLTSGRWPSCPIRRVNHMLRDKESGTEP